MAEVFVSYERSAEHVARATVEALRREGHVAWSDDMLPPHRDFSEVIEERLRSADIVLVLWSTSAAHSQWVRAEANFAREASKLVQATLDENSPPLPFNQIQCARLRGWNGNSEDAEWRKILDSIAELSGTQASAAALTGGRPRSLVGPLVAALAVAGILACALWFGRGLLDRPAPPPVRIAILPFDTLSPSPDAKYFADSLTDQILTTLNDNHLLVVSHDDAVTLRGVDREKRVAELGVGLLLDGTVQSDGKTVDVTVHLDDPLKHATLWSSGVTGPADAGSQLQAELATAIVRVLDCSKDALNSARGLTDPAVLSRYLHACDLFSNRNFAASPKDTFDTLEALRSVTEQAPNFARAHADLAQIGGYLAPLLPPDQAKPLRLEAAVEAQRALALDPKSATSYLAEEELLPLDRWSDRERLLRQGVAAEPLGTATGFLGMTLADAGRLNEAIAFTRKAATGGAYGWDPEDDIVEAGAGDPQRCVDDMTKIVKVTPHDTFNWLILNQCLQFAGDWDEALAMIHDESNRPPLPAGAYEATEAYIKAARSHATADLEAAHKLNADLAGKSNLELVGLIQRLSTLGFLDDAFAAAGKYELGWPITGSESDFLFFKSTAAMRRDKRFMNLAARLGLVDFWRASNRWPDFCSEPGLPYDCRAEAARATRGG